MSAFIVSDDHISAIVCGAHTYLEGSVNRAASRIARLGITNDDDYTATGKALARENVESFRFLYSNRHPCPEVAYSYKAPARCPSVVGLLKLIQCYRYQACEHPQWEGSIADDFTKALSDRLITALPGYDEAPWAL